MNKVAEYFGAIRVNLGFELSEYSFSDFRKKSYITKVNHN